MGMLERLIPPILEDVVRRYRPSKRATALFDGDDAAFREIVSSARLYGEYGVGASTECVYGYTDARIVAVESSPEWAAKVTDGKDTQRLRLHLVDLGATGAWGYPIAYSRREHFQVYTDWIWRRGDKPDVVLIDGRFRVACFFTSVLIGEPGTTIIFDDYRDRRHYHIVEEMLRPYATCGRQAIFRRPAAVDTEALQELIDQFRMVRD